MKRNSSYGFTLVEVIITLGVAAILLMIAAPSFTSFVRRYRITTTAQTLYFRLQNAKTEAIKRNTTVYVSFNPGSNWCYGVSTGASCDCTTASNCNLGTESYNDIKGLTLSVSRLSSNAIYFESTHAAANAAGSITIAPTGQSSPLITISIGRLGSLQMCSTNIGGYTAC